MKIKTFSTHNSQYKIILGLVRNKILYIIFSLVIYSSLDLPSQTNDLSHGTLYSMSNTSIFSTNNFKCLEVDEENNIWVGTAGNGLTIFNGINWEPVYNEFGMTGFIVRTMKRNPANGDIWIGMSKTTYCLGTVGGIYRYSNKNTYERYLPPLPHPIITDQSKPEDMYATLFSLGLINVEYYRLFNYYDFLEYYNPSLPSLCVRSFDFNKVTGENWVSCTPQTCEPKYNGGIAFNHSGEYKAIKTSLPAYKNGDRFITAITSDRDGYVYAAVGRSCGDSCEAPYINLYSKTGGITEVFTGTEIPSKFIDIDTHLPFVFVTQTPLPLTKSSSSLAIRTLFVDTKNRIWVGGELNGIGVGNYSSWQFLNNYNIHCPEGAIVNFDAITEGPDGTIYIGTNKGLLTFKGDNVADFSKWKNILVNGTIESINSIKFDNLGNLWIATNQGIFLSKKEEPKFARYYIDKDADGFGDPTTSLLRTEQPDGYVKDNTDCNDDPNNDGFNVNPGIIPTDADLTVEVQNPLGKNCGASIIVTYLRKNCSDSYDVKILDDNGLTWASTAGVTTKSPYKQMIDIAFQQSENYTVKITDSKGIVLQKPITITVPENLPEIRYNIIKPSPENCSNIIEIELISNDCFLDWSAEIKIEGSSSGILLEDNGDAQIVKKGKKITYEVFIIEGITPPVFSISNVYYRFINGDIIPVPGKQITSGIEVFKGYNIDVGYVINTKPSTSCSNDGNLTFTFRTLNPCFDQFFLVFVEWKSFAPPFERDVLENPNYEKIKYDGQLYYTSSITIENVRAGYIEVTYGYTSPDKLVYNSGGILSLTLTPENFNLDNILSFNISKTDIPCAKDASATIIASVKGGTPPYKFQWSQQSLLGQTNLSETSNLLTVNWPGKYYLKVTDDIGCIVELENTRSYGIEISSLCEKTPKLNSIFAKQMNGPDPEAKKVVVDKSGNTYVIGEYILTATFNTSSLTSLGGNDIFIAKYSPEGELLWVASVGSSSEDKASNIIMDESGTNVYLTGNCKGSSVFFLSPSANVINRIGIGSSDFFVAKLDPATGNFISAKMSGANSNSLISDKQSMAIGVSPDGTSIYVCGGISACGNGTYAGNSIPDKTSCGSPFVAFLSKYDSNCELVAVVIPESDGNVCGDEMMTGLYVQPSTSVQDAEKIFVAGYTSGQLNIGGNIIGEDDKIESYYAMYAPTFASGNPPPQKFNWISNGSGQTTGIVTNDNGFVYLLHNIKDGDLNSCNSFVKDSHEDAYLTKFNNDGLGACLWNTRLATKGFDKFESIALGKKDTVFVAGFTSGSPFLGGTVGFANQGGNDGFVIQYDGNGNPYNIWDIGGSGEDFTYGITTNQFGGIYIVGSLKNSFIFLDTDTLQSVNDETDGYIVSLSKFTPIRVSSVSTLNICKGEAIDVEFVSPECNQGNIFTVQLSDKNGSFNSPIDIGTLNGISSGNIHSIIPTTIQAGNNYRVRVISSNPSNNGIDNKKNITVTQPPLYYSDEDGDTYGGVLLGNFCSPPKNAVLIGGDCDDSNSSIHPNGTEICNGLDDNCNGLIDDADPAITGRLIFFADNDGDGFGNSNNTKEACSVPTGYVSNSTDCNDSDPAIHPGTAETCNGLDDNCNGIIDEGVQLTFYKDNDSDGFGTSTSSVQACTQPLGFVSNNTDCNDNNANTYPGATEVCNGIDDNCNAQIDEGVKLTFFRDADRDGFGNPALTKNACSVPSGYVVDNTDCDDSKAFAYPGATELCNGIDDNCNGQIDEFTKKQFYRDADGDGYGNPKIKSISCEAPPGYVANSNDCNDANANIHPNIPELCNGFDDNCNALVDEGCAPKYNYFADIDGDSFGDPNNAIISSDNFPPFGYVANNTDCNDANAAIHPVATEICNNLDDNCNGQVDEDLAPINPGSVSGPTFGVCKNSIQTYSVAPQFGAAFIWIAPANANIISGQGSNTVTVSYSNSFVSGILSVTATKCITSAASILAISSVPSMPSAINGQASVCTNAIESYTCPSVSGATFYTWSTPGGSIILSGQGSTSISIQHGASALMGNLSVRALNACGSSTTKSLSITILNCAEDVVDRSETDKIIPQREQIILDVIAIPNPSNNHFTMIVNSPSDQLIDIRIFDVTGRQMNMQRKNIREPITLGDELKPGAYIAEIIQGNSTKTIKLIKI